MHLSTIVFLFAFDSIIVPGYLNQYHNKAGCWVSIFFIILGSCLLSLLGEEDGEAVLHTVQLNRLDKDKGRNEELKQRFNNMLDQNLNQVSCKTSDIPGNLAYMTRLCHSDPELVPSPRLGRNMVRQATWHRLGQTNNGHDLAKDRLVWSWTRSNQLFEPC